MLSLQQFSDAKYQTLYFVFKSVADSMKKLRYAGYNKHNHLVFILLTVSSTKSSGIYYFVGFLVRQLIEVACHIKYAAFNTF